MKLGYHEYHLETILCNMCRVADIDYFSIDRTQTNWYCKGSWSQKTENRFSSWLADYIHKMPAAQRELYGTSYMRKKDCIQATQLFILNYGWKIKK